MLCIELHRQQVYKRALLFPSTNLPFISLSSQSSLCSSSSAPAPLTATVGYMGGGLLHPQRQSSSSSVCPTGIDEPGRQRARQQACGNQYKQQCAPPTHMTSDCQTNCRQTFEMSPKNRMCIRCVFITWLGSE